MIKINNMNPSFEKCFVKTNYLYTRIVSPVKINSVKINFNEFKYKEHNEKDIKYIHYDDPMHSQK
jgi:hypothetical protein